MSILAPLAGALGYAALFGTLLWASSEIAERRERRRINRIIRRMEEHL